VFAGGRDVPRGNHALQRRDQQGTHTAVFANYILIRYVLL